MKALFDEFETEIISIGSLTGIEREQLIFNSDIQNKDIVRFIEMNLKRFSLNEFWSCVVTLEDNTVTISGDEDSKIFSISRLRTLL